MNTKIHIYIRIGVALLVLSLITSVAMLIRKSNKLKEDYERQSRNVITLTSPAHTDTIRDTVTVTTQGSIEESVQELKHQHIIDTKLVSDLKIKLRDIEHTSTISKSMTDTVVLIRHDSTYHYADFWTNIDIDLRSSRCMYQVRDSISTIIYRKYKHHFLWWRWGAAGYEVKIINFNPHSKINYNQTIKISK